MRPLIKPQFCPRVAWLSSAVQQSTTKASSMHGNRSQLGEPHHIGHISTVYSGGFACRSIHRSRRPGKYQRRPVCGQQCIIRSTRYDMMSYSSIISNLFVRRQMDVLHGTSQKETICVGNVKVLQRFFLSKSYDDHAVSCPVVNSPFQPDKLLYFVGITH